MTVKTKVAIHTVTCDEPTMRMFCAVRRRLIIVSADVPVRDATRGGEHRHRHARHQRLRGACRPRRPMPVQGGGWIAEIDEVTAHRAEALLVLGEAAGVRVAG